jgi:hypothetical protein
MVLAGLIVSSARAERPPVQFRLIAEGRVSPTQYRHWIEMLAKLDVANVRISSAKTVKLDVKNIGTAARPAYKITGLLSSGGVLRVPGGEFKVTDSAKLGRWLDQIGEGGKEAVTVPRTAFGMTPTQYEQVRADLSRAVDFSTKGQTATGVLNRISRSLTYKMSVDAAARQALGSKQIVIEELQGLSSGTAMAIILRPAGLSLRPIRSGRKSLYRVFPADPKTQPWPVGWSPEQKARALVPALYEFLNYEIEDVPLPELLDALTLKLKVKYIQDQNSMVLHRVDFKASKATLGKGRTYYGKILSRALGQSKLKYELRVDEAGTPLLWITTLKR